MTRPKKRKKAPMNEPTRPGGHPENPRVDPIMLHPHQMKAGDKIVGFTRDGATVSEVRYVGEYPHKGMQAELGSKYLIVFSDGFELAATGKGTKPVIREA